LIIFTGTLFRAILDVDFTLDVTDLFQSIRFFPEDQETVTRVSERGKRKIAVVPSTLTIWHFPDFTINGREPDIRYGS